jgi:hypothetical protein
MSERKTPDDVSNEQIWNRLSVILEKQTELENKIEKIEKQTQPAGGSQPQQKFTKSSLYTEKNGQRVLSDLGAEIRDFLESKQADNQSRGYAVNKQEFEDFMASHGYTASTNKTILNWMRRVCDCLSTWNFKVGERGGRNLPSRIVTDNLD